VEVRGEIDPDADGSLLLDTENVNLEISQNRNAG
jgi:hypothetical protein